MIGDLYVAKSPSEDGTYRIIEQISKRLQNEKGCSRYYMVNVVKGGSIGYTFTLTEKQLREWYKKLTHQHEDKGE